MEPFKIQVVDWNSHCHQLSSVRHEVFVVEQKVPANVEIDAADSFATHLLAVDYNGAAIGTSRVLADGHIGRVAVLAEWRGQGIGRALTEAAVDHLRSRHFKEARLNSQIQVVEFYEKFGFVAQGEIFYECDIPHVAMRKEFF